MKHTKKNLIFITNRGVCRLFWFAIGHGLQLVLHALFQNWWEQYQIPLCASAGFVVLLFFFAGSWVTAKEQGGAHWEDLQ